MTYPECSKFRNDGTIVAEENGKKLILDNTDNRRCINQMKVDGCVPITGVRCDYLFEIYRKDISENSCPPESPKIEKVIYLELKGKNIKHAFEQLESTIRFFGQAHQCRKEAYVVGTKMSPAFRTRTQEAMTKFREELKTKLEVKNVSLTISV